jgi:predicted dithiol-disulfide oxidoreductase (DUF899 family)
VRPDFPINRWAQPFDLHGLSCFLRDGQTVHHTYSTYGRGTEAVGGTNYFLDLTALGRQEPWEEPKDRTEDLGPQPDGERDWRPARHARLRYPDEYDQP